ncbi:sulfotransferase family protein, partial [Chromohalobacter israelensis]|uniref:sulfotransferase family 2 domain-containing protein n=2 Tax=Chromohalobacter israelensis TaxID=141390 RepID=UPI00240ACB46
EMFGDIWGRYRKVALVRNPFDRALSLYSYMLLAPGHAPHRRFCLESFGEFIRCDAFIKGEYISAAQYEYVRSGDVEIFKLEDLSKNWPLISESLGLDGNSVIIHKNRSNSEKYALSEGDKDVLRNIWREDFENLGYD